MLSSYAKLLSAAIALLAIDTSSSFGCPPPERLSRLLKATDSGESPIILMPCCYDGITARLVAQSGFNATFMTGFGVSGANGYPDTQLVSFNEMVLAAGKVAEGLSSAALEQVKYGEPDYNGEPQVTARYCFLMTKKLLLYAIFCILKNCSESKLLARPPCCCCCCHLFSPHSCHLPLFSSSYHRLSYHRHHCYHHCRSRRRNNESDQE